MRLDIKVATLRKWIREGKIKGRRIPNGPYMILRKDNPNLTEVLDGLLQK
jgi:predicted site-specific integrase-resolvase